ncbi:MAG: hypothetical protein U9R34_06180 [Nanoarchaeota archaeon]|nr:hypothetical protein [Nanoarchaeota archaeon]
MQLLNYALTALVANAGIVFGILLVYIAEEEIKPGRNYFIIMKNLMIAMVLAAVMHIFISNIILISIVSALFIALLFFIDYKIIRLYFEIGKNRIKIIVECITRIAAYALLGAAFYISSRDITYFIIVSSLALLYGFPAGSLALNNKKANKLRIILTSSSFFVIAMLLYIIA